MSRSSITKAYARALALHASHDEAIETIAQAMALPPETVNAALQPIGHCCGRGENLGVPVCEECADVSAGYQSAMFNHEAEAA